MEEEHALIEVKKLDVAVVFSEDGMTKILEKIKAKAKELTPDLSTDSGRKEIASMAYKVARSKTLLDDLGKGVIADWKEKVDNINKHRKAARDFLDSLKEEVRQPLTDWEAEQEKIQAEKIRLEEERVAGIRAVIEVIRACRDISPWMISGGMKSVRQRVVELKFNFQEFDSEAKLVTTETLEILDGLIAKRLQFEKEEIDRKAESERLEKVRMALEAEAAKLKAAQDKIDKDARKVAADKAALEADKKAEQERKDRESFEAKAKEEARIKAEQEAQERFARVEREKKEREEREAREAKEKAEAEAAEKARKEALKPDKDKILAWAKELNQRLLDMRPDLSSPEAKRIIDAAEGTIDISIITAVQKAKEL